MITETNPTSKIEQEASALVLKVNDDRLRAILFVQERKREAEKIKTDAKPAIDAAHAEHKRLLKDRDDALAPYQRAVATVERMVSEFDQAAERIRRAEELRLQEEARKRQEEQLLAEAQSLQDQGDTLGAECVLAEAINTPAPVVVAPSQVAKVTGAYSRQMPWQFRVENPDKLKDEYWTPDIDSIGAIVKAKGEMADLIVGKGSLRVWRDSKTIIKK